MEINALDVSIILMLIIISAVGIATRRFQFPYPIALLITGIVLGAIVRSVPSMRSITLDSIPFTPHLILVLFLPALLFEATLHLEATTLYRTLIPIGLLAVPGVLISAGIVGALVHWGVGLTWPMALLFGAIVAATDPIAVVAIFKRLGAPHDLATLVEGESLFNDGTAVVLSRILLGVMLSGELNLVSGVWDFVVVVGGGFAIGVLCGSLASRLTARLDDHLVEITLTTILAYGSFSLAEALHVSGVIAVVFAGLMLSNIGARHGMSPTTRLALLTFWEYIAFLLNSVIFLLIGLQVEFQSLLANALPIAIAIGAVLLARVVVVCGLSLPLALPRAWLYVLFWSGLRGALSLAVALTLPIELPERSLLLALTFGVVLFTLLVPGLTMEPLLRRFGLAGADQRRQMYLARRAELLTLRAGWRELQRLESDALVSPRVYAKLDDTYRASGLRVHEDLDALYEDDQDLEVEELRVTKEHLLRVERVALAELQRRGQVDSDTAHSLAQTIDTRLDAVRSEKGTH